jgi:hypothetical protein
MVDDSGAALNDSSSWGMLCYKLRQAVPGCLLWGAHMALGNCLFLREPVVAGILDHALHRPVLALVDFLVIPLCWELNFPGVIQTTAVQLLYELFRCVDYACIFCYFCLFPEDRGAESRAESMPVASDVVQQPLQQQQQQQSASRVKSRNGKGKGRINDATAVRSSSSGKQLQVDVPAVPLEPAAATPEAAGAAAATAKGNRKTYQTTRGSNKHGAGQQNNSSSSTPTSPAGIVQPAAPGSPGAAGSSSTAVSTDAVTFSNKGAW